MVEIAAKDVFEAGVVGAGGAGFPTHVKLAGKADTVLINAAECEPLLHKDKEVLRAYVDDVAYGTAVAMRLVGAQRGVVGIKEKYGDVIDLLRSKLSKSIAEAVLPPQNTTPTRAAATSTVVIILVMSGPPFFFRSRSVLTVGGRTCDRLRNACSSLSEAHQPPHGGGARH